jgi:hypothetical protein
VAADEELNEALDQQRTGFVEEDIVEALAKTFEVDEGIVRRLFFAFGCVVNMTDMSLVPSPSPCRVPTIPDWAHRLGGPLIDAISMNVGAAVARLQMAEAIRRAVTIDIDIRLLLDPKDVKRICDGCPERIECMADNLHTPEECYGSLRRRMTVFPLRMTRDAATVEAQQPRGTYTVRFDKIRPRSNLFKKES